MTVIKPSIPKGTRDFLPETMVKRQFVINTMRDIFERYGYEPLETPSIEKLDVLSGKYGDEGEKLIFKVLRRGTGLEDLLKGKKEFIVERYSQLVEEALRYDLTVPLSRVVAMYQNELTLPFKRYQIQPVWRADRPQRGRYREFYQCDVDTIGATSMLADAEAIAVVHDVLTALGFSNFKTKINHRKILSGMLECAGIGDDQKDTVFIIIDKLEKIGLEGVRAELLQLGLSTAQVDRLVSILDVGGNVDKILEYLSDQYGESQTLQEGVSELRELQTYLQGFGVSAANYELDLYLVRGLGYYTGPIYESVVTEPKMGSLTGGGRYDNLIGMFLGRDIPATGTAFGIERIIDVMNELNMFPTTRTKTQILMAAFEDTTLPAALSVAQELRRHGFHVESYPDTAKLKKQFSYADKRGIPFVIIIGPDEQQAEEITIKHLQTGDQKRVELKTAISYLKERLT